MVRRHRLHEEHRRLVASMGLRLPDIRRRQIVEAAAAIVADQGLQNLSLSEIEKRLE